MHFRISEIQLWLTEEASPQGTANTKRIPEKQNLVLSDQYVMMGETINSQVLSDFSAPAHQSILTDREIKRKDDKDNASILVN